MEKIHSIAALLAAGTAQSKWEAMNDDRKSAWTAAYAAVASDVAAGHTAASIAKAAPKGSGIQPATVGYCLRASRIDDPGAWEAVEKLPARNGKKPNTIHAVVRIAGEAITLPAVDAMIGEALAAIAKAASATDDAETISTRRKRAMSALINALYNAREEKKDDGKKDDGKKDDGNTGGGVTAPAPAAESLDSRIAKATAEIIALREIIAKSGDTASRDALAGLLREAGSLAREVADYLGKAPQAVAK